MSLEVEQLKLEKRGGGSMMMEERGIEQEGGQEKEVHKKGGNKLCVALFKLVGHKLQEDGVKSWNRLKKNGTTQPLGEDWRGRKDLSAFRQTWKSLHTTNSAKEYKKGPVRWLTTSLSTILEMNGRLDIGL